MHPSQRGIDSVAPEALKIRFVFGEEKRGCPFADKPILAEGVVARLDNTFVSVTIARCVNLDDDRPIPNSRYCETKG